MRKKKKIKAKKAPARKRVITRKANPISYFFRRIIVITACIALFFSSFVLLNRKTLPQSVLGASIVRPLYSQSIISWKPVSGALWYNIYYKLQSDNSYIHAVRNIPANITTYTVSYLKKGASYQYRISALNAKDAEFWWSDTMWMTNIEAM